jgi:hypothetical protein
MQAELAARAGINYLVLGIARGARKLRACALTHEYFAGADERLQGGGVQRGTLTLTHNLAVVLKTVGGELCMNSSLSFGGATRLINVLNAQQPPTTGGARIGVARHRRYQRAEVQRPSGRGREAAHVGPRLVR